MREFRIIDIISSPNAILHSSGLKIFESIAPYLSKGQSVALSFEGIKNITSGFCNASIGKVYLEYKNAAELLHIEGINSNPVGRRKILESIDLATNPDKRIAHNRAISDLLCS